MNRDGDLSIAAVILIRTFLADKLVEGLQYAAAVYLTSDEYNDQVSRPLCDEISTDIYAVHVFIPKKVLVV